ncbi:MAG: hypothetical protein HS113_08910 [Verrucomicrobiales bacterium]|nr:hypothetical protein [Verrucomicrobiales bacterium]
MNRKERPSEPGAGLTSPGWRPGGWLRVGGVVVARVCGGGGSHRARADERPGLGAVVAIRAANFVDNLGPHRAGCEAAAARVLAELGAEHFSYLDWRPHAGVAEAGAPRLWLIAEMQGVDRGFGHEITLRYLAGSATGEVPLSSLPRLVLYQATDMQPTQNTNAILAVLERTFRDHFNESEDFRRALQRDFLAAVPLTTTLICRTNLKQFLVPVTWRRLLPGDGSLLLATYRSRPPDGAGDELFPVTLRLRPLHDWAEGVGCRVRRFDYPGLELPEQETWHELMPESLGRAVPGTVEVVMEAYQKDRRYLTRGTLVTAPEVR